MVVTEFSGENGLDNTDIAVLDALVSGGAVLSLKAHFIDSIPDISPITSTIRYLNLSFNNFTVSAPYQICAFIRVTIAMICLLAVLHS